MLALGRIPRRWLGGCARSRAFPATLRLIRRWARAGAACALGDRHACGGVGRARSGRVGSPASPRLGVSPATCAASPRRATTRSVTTRSATTWSAATRSAATHRSSSRQVHVYVRQLRRKPPRVCAHVGPHALRQDGLSARARLRLHTHQIPPATLPASMADACWVACPPPVEESPLDLE